MHWWKKICLSLAFALAVSACDVLRHQVPGALDVRDARIVSAADGAQLEIDLDCQLNGPMSDALEHGIPITLRIDLRAQTRPLPLSDRREIELRYFPLSRRYQLRDLASGNVRSFSAFGSLVDSLGALRLPMPSSFDRLAAGTRVSIEIALDHGALPGPLRLPALIEPAWKLAAPEYTWIVAAG